VCTQLNKLLSGKKICYGDVHSYASFVFDEKELRKASGKALAPAYEQAAEGPAGYFSSKKPLTHLLRPYNRNCHGTVFPGTAASEKDSGQDSLHGVESSIAALTGESPSADSFTFTNLKNYN
jgi:hypothetical protein